MTNAALAIQLLLTLATQAQSTGNLLAQAQAAGRDLTDAELDTLHAAVTASAGLLAAAITAARTQGLAPAVHPAPSVPPTPPRT